MTREELLKSLGLDDAPSPTGDGGVVQIDSQVIRPTVPQSDNALVLDRWTKRQGRQLFKQLETEKATLKTTRPVHDMDAVDLADLHQAVFDPSPELALQEACSDTSKWTYFNELNETPGFHELRQSTVLDDAATELAIERLSDGLVKVRAQENQEDGNSLGGISREAGKAVNQAKEDVQQLEETREAMGCGGGPGCSIGLGAGGQYDVKKTLELYKKIRTSKDLQKIVNLAGKYRLFGQSQQRRKISHGNDDLVGVTIGGDLARLTQSEFLGMGIPELEDDVCLRLLDNQAMVQEWHGQQPVAKGPIIVAIDESGSMTTEGADGCSRIQHAKALALSFAYLAHQQRRWCALIGWSSYDQRRTIVLPPGQWDQDALLVWLTGFLSGGTVPPVQDMPDIYQAIGAPVGKTDICYITDGDIYLEPSHIPGFNAWKESVQAKVISLVIAGSAGSIGKISDELHLIKALGLNEAVGSALSI